MFALGVLALSVLVIGLVINSYFNGSNSSFDVSSNKLPSVDSESQISATPTPESFVTPSAPPSGSIIVPDDFSTISQAIATASDGQTIFVRKGCYNESVIVDKSLWLIGENQTLIDAHSVGVDLLISHSNVNVTGFTLQNTPTPATGSWIEQMQGIGLSKQLADIQVVNAQNCNVYKNNLTNSLTAVALENSTQNTIINNQIIENAYGVEFDWASDNCIISNVFVSSGMAIHLENGACANEILDNRVTNSSYAIYLDSASGNTLKGNTLTHNLRGFGVNGNDISDFVNTVDASNTIDGKPIYYVVGQINGIVPSDAGNVVLVSCINMTVQNTNLHLGYHEITLANTNNSVVKGNGNLNTDPALLEANYMPQPPIHIFLYRSFNNNLIDNHGTVLLNDSCSNTLTGNAGVMSLYRSDENKIFSNRLHPDLFDVAYGNGVALDASCNNLIKQNTISNNIGGAGIMVVDASNNNVIVDNDIVSNVGGIILSTAIGDLFGTNPDDPQTPRNNLIYRNNVTGNQNQGIFDLGFCTQIIGNTFTKNSNWGVQLSNSENSTIIGNTIDGLNLGVFGNGTRNALIVANNITCNSQVGLYSVWLVTAYPATFYQNNFFGPINFSHYADNYKNSTISDAVGSIWDNSGQGNFWSSYSGVDVNGDGVGDTPISLGFGYFDNYPLMAPYDISLAIPPAPV